MIKYDDGENVECENRCNVTNKKVSSNGKENKRKN